ncbi:Solute carrier 26 [Cladochytrium tenue]|nr:Solute carrier 26 [Cladochytrium tenue]
MIRRKLLVEALHGPAASNDSYASFNHASSDQAMERLVVNLFSRPRLSASSMKTRLKEFSRWAFPLIGQMKTYTLRLFAEDALAGLTVAFVLLPQSIAYAGLAQVSPIQAFISAVFPPVLYIIFGSSRQLSIGPEAMVSVITGSAIISLFENNPSYPYTPAQIASALTLVVGIICMVLAAMRAGFIDNILSGYLLTGFVFGGASMIMVEQLPELLGIEVDLQAQESTIGMLVEAYNHLHDTTWQVAAISACNIAFLFSFGQLKKRLGRKFYWLSRTPEILVLVVVMITVSAALDFKGRGISVLGTFDNKLRAPQLPPLNPELLKKLIGPAMTIALNGFIECQTVTRDFGLRHGYFPSGDQELFSLGFMNFFSAFLGAYPTFGSLPRSHILAQSGSRTTLASVMAGIFVLIALMTLVPVLQHLPHATLSSIVFVAALALIDVKEIAFVFRLRAWSEIAMFLATYVITLVTSITTGVIICLTLSALLIVRRTTTASMSVLGRVQYHIPDHHPEPPVFGRKKFDQSPELSMEAPSQNLEGRTGIGLGTNHVYRWRAPNSTAVVGGHPIFTPNVTNPSGHGGDASIHITTINSSPGESPPRLTAASSGTITPEPTVPRGWRDGGLSTTPVSYVNVDEHPSAEMLDGVLLLRIEVPLLFYNAGQARRAIDALMQAELKLARDRDRRRRQRRRVAGATGTYDAVGTDAPVTLDDSPKGDADGAVSAREGMQAPGAISHTMLFFGLGGSRRRAASRGAASEGAGNARAWQRMDEPAGARETGLAEAVAISLNAIDKTTTGAADSASSRPESRASTAAKPGTRKERKRTAWKRRRRVEDARGAATASSTGRRDDDLDTDGGSSAVEYGSDEELGPASRPRSRAATTSSAEEDAGTVDGDWDGTDDPEGSGADDEDDDDDDDEEEDGEDDDDGDEDERTNGDGESDAEAGAAATATAEAPARRAWRPRRGRLHTIVLDFARCTDLDSAATFVLRKILRAFSSQGVRVLLVSLRDAQVSQFQRGGMAALLDGNMFGSVAAAVEEVEARIGEAEAAAEAARKRRREGAAARFREEGGTGMQRMRFDEA